MGEVDETYQDPPKNVRRPKKRNRKQKTVNARNPPSRKKRERERAQP